MRLERRDFIKKSLAGAAGLGLAALFGACEPMASDQKRVFDQINFTRGAHGLHALQDDHWAHQKAEDWSEYLASTDQLRHSNLSDGMDEVNWKIIGENVGRGGSLESIHHAFMASSSHKANILNPNYTHVGTGVTFNGQYYVVHVFYA